MGFPAKPELSTGPIGEGLKRRDFLLIRSQSFWT